MGRGVVIESSAGTTPADLSGNQETRKAGKGSRATRKQSTGRGCWQRLRLAQQESGRSTPPPGALPPQLCVCPSSSLVCRPSSTLVVFAAGHDACDQGSSTCRVRVAAAGHGAQRATGGDGSCPVLLPARVPVAAGITASWALLDMLCPATMCIAQFKRWPWHGADADQWPPLRPQVLPPGPKVKIDGVRQPWRPWGLTLCEHM